MKRRSQTIPRFPTGYDLYMRNQNPMFRTGAGKTTLMSCDINSAYPFNMIRSVKLTGSAAYGKAEEMVRVIISIPGGPGGESVTYDSGETDSIAAIEDAIAWLKSEKRRRRGDHA